MVAGEVTMISSSSMVARLGIDVLAVLSQKFEGAICSKGGEMEVHQDTPSVEGILGSHNAEGPVKW